MNLPKHAPLGAKWATLLERARFWPALGALLGTCQLQACQMHVSAATQITATAESGAGRPAEKRPAASATVPAARFASGAAATGESAQATPQLARFAAASENRGQSAANDQAQLLGHNRVDPETASAIIAGAIAGKILLENDAATPALAALDSLIAARARQLPTSSRSVGPLLSSKLAPNGHASSLLSLDPSTCYAVIGAAADGVRLALHLLSAPPAAPEVLADGVAAAPVTTLGLETCLATPRAAGLSTTLDLHALEGRGLVAARVYAWPAP